MSDAIQDKPGVEHANSLYVSRCDCPSIHIVLVRKDGAPFAVAADLLEQIAEARAGTGDTIGRCEGHA